MSEGAVNNHAGQLYAFAKTMEKGDWVVLPLKTKPVIAVGRSPGANTANTYDPKAPGPYYHRRTVRWIAKDIPRTRFDNRHWVQP